MIIRAASKEDVPALAALHIEGWHAAYGGLVDDEALNTPTLESRIDQWKEWIHLSDSRTYIAIDDKGAPTGFISCGRLRTPVPGMSPVRPLYTSEVYGLYLLPAYYRQGIGTALMRAGVKGLHEMKHKSLCLWVLEKNDRAVSFYKKLGGERCGKKEIEIGKSRVKEICFGWRNSGVQFL